MVNRIAGYWSQGPPPNRLERWLVRTIQAGGLDAFPRYAPPGRLGLHSPEQYARTLLTRMRSAADDPLALERVKDDGRAFRSWAEAVRPMAV
jgi:hypothetical protein